MNSERLTEVRNLAEEYARISVRDNNNADRLRRQAICQLALGFNPVEMAHFCQQLVSYATSTHLASAWLTVFTNRLTDRPEGFVHGEALLLRGGRYWAVVDGPSEFGVYAVVEVDEVVGCGFRINGSHRMTFINAADVIRRTFQFVELPEVVTAAYAAWGK